MLFVPLNQECGTFGTGIGIYWDSCTDTAEIISICVCFCFVFFAMYRCWTYVFAAALFSISLFQCVFGATVGMQNLYSALLCSRELSIPVTTWVLTWGHTFFNRSSDQDAMVCTCLSVCTNYVVALCYTGLAFALATASIICYETGASSPNVAFLVFDAVGVAIGSFWLSNFSWMGGAEK